MPPQATRKKPQTDERKSHVWKFYQRPDDSHTPSVPCPDCKKPISYSGSTSTLRYHLQHVHSKEYAEIIEKQSTSKTGWPPTMLARNAEKSLGRFSESQDFRRFVRYVQQCQEPFRTPSASKMRRIIENLNNDHLTKLRHQLKHVTDFTIITDGYSDLRRGFQFYSLHVSYIELNFNRKLLFCGIQGTKGGDVVSIGETLCELMKKFGLQFTDCSEMTSDGATPLILLASSHNLDRIHYACHLLNLIISDFATNRDVRNIEKRVQNFSYHLSRTKSDKTNVKSMSLSRGITSPLPLSLPATRWAGLHLMLKQYVEHLENDSSYASETIPAFRYVQSSVSRSSSKFSKVLGELVAKSMNEVLENRRLLCTMAVGHRYAYIEKWITPKKWTDVERDLEEYLKEEPNSDEITPCTQDSGHDDENIDAFMNSSLVNCESKSDKIQSELLSYKALLDTNRPSFEDPLDFWKVNEQNFPKLARIASELLGSPASSSASERVFSRCTDILRQTKRNRAKLHTLNELLTTKELSRIEQEEERDGSDDEEIHESSSEETSEEEEWESEVDDADMNDRYPTGSTTPLSDS